MKKLQIMEILSLYVFLVFVIMMERILIKTIIKPLNYLKSQPKKGIQGV